MDALLQIFLMAVMLAFVLIWAWLSWNKRKSYVVVNEVYVGLKYADGKFVEVLAPGRHRIATAREYIRPVFMGKYFVSIQGQEILTSEQAQIKMSLLVSYEIKDVVEAMHRQEDVKQVLYWQAQIVLREVVLEATLDQCLQTPRDLQAKLLPLLQERLQETGLEITEVYLKDIMLSGELKRAYHKVLLAKKESQASLEKVRGEQATLRSLANAARQLDKNPSLQQLRWLHTVENSKTSHTVHLHLSGESTYDSLV